MPPRRNKRAGTRKSPRKLQPCARRGRPKTTGEEPIPADDEPLPADDEPVVADAELLPAGADSHTADDDEEEEPKKKKMSRRHFTDDDRDEFFKNYRALCDDPKTKDLSVAQKYVLCNVKYSTGARWHQFCQICSKSYPVIKDNLAKCGNCEEILCIICVSRCFCTELSEATRGDFRSLHSIKCPYCRHPHAFRPANGDHGRQSRDISTSVFQAHVIKIIHDKIDTVNRIGGKLSTQLCLLNGRLMDLLKRTGSTQELSSRYCRNVSDLDVFSRQFGSAAYAQSDLGTAMKTAFRSGKWVKERCDSGSHLEMFSKINDCDYVIEGLREYVFSLCCDVFERIRRIVNIREKTAAYEYLGSIWASREAEKCQSVASRARETPVDLTEDTLRGGSDNE